MTPPELAGVAEAMREIIDRECGALRADLAAVRRDLDAARAAPVFTAGLIDAAGDLRLVQRNGDTLTIRIADLPAIVAEAVTAHATEAEQRLGARLDSQVARAAQRLGDAPRWLRTALYTPGAVVSFYNGRTYELRTGVAASMSQEPGEHPDVWERIGSHGLRVMKAKPEATEPGDVYAETESRFISDGETTTLLAARTLKQSDVERTVKPIASQVAALGERAANNARELESVRADLRLLQAVANEH